VSQAKKTGLGVNGTNDLSDDELTDDNPPLKRGRNTTNAFLFEDVTAPTLSMHETPRVAKSTRGGRYTQKRSKVRSITHPLSEPALTQRANHKERGTSVEIDMPTTMDESEASTGDEFALRKDHPTTEEELSVVGSDHDPTPKKKVNRNKTDIRAAIEARRVVQEQRERTDEVR
jgi:hypothetical protein